MSEEFRKEMDARRNYMGIIDGNPGLDTAYIILQDQLISGEMIAYDCMLDDRCRNNVHDIAACAIIGNTQRLKYMSLILPKTVDWVTGKSSVRKTLFSFRKFIGSLFFTSASKQFVLFLTLQAIYGRNKIENKIIELWTAIMTFKYGTPAGLFNTYMPDHPMGKYIPGVWILGGRK